MHFDLLLFFFVVVKNLKLLCSRINFYFLIFFLQMILKVPCF